MTSLKTSIKTITYLSDIGCLEIQGASLVVIKECVDMYVPNPLKNNIKLYYKETESESHRVIIDNILKLKQLTRICMR
ncbi:transcriptional regulator [Escherichia coli]|nr:transcriptional regulator [Escherichia coli]